MIVPMVFRFPLLAPAMGAAFIGGIVLSTANVALPTWQLGAALAAGTGAAIATNLGRRRWPPAISVLALAFGLGVLRGGSATAEVPEPWTPPPSRIEVQGTVEDPVTSRGAVALLVLRVERAEVTPSPGPESRVQLVVDPLPSFGVGDRVRVVGRFEPLNAALPFEQALLRRGMTAISRFPDVQRLDDPGPTHAPALLLHRLRARLEMALQQALPEPQAGLTAGLLVGATGSFSEDMRQSLIASGTSHLVVVSGYNISLVAAALVGLVRGRRWLGAVLPLAGVWFFTLLAGAGPPSVRAAIMATAALTAVRLGRGADPLGALALTAAGMLAWAPALALELSFQLSALATLGLIGLQPRVAALGPWAPRLIREPIAGTIAAQLATIPVLAASFHQISAVAPLSNGLAAPAVPLATITAAILTPIVAAVPAVAPVAGLLLAIPSTYLLAVIEGTARLPQAMVPVPDLPSGLTALYGLALLAWAALPTPEGRDALARIRSMPGLASLLVALPVGGLIGSVAGTAITPSSSPLAITIFDAGGSPALFARTPSGQTILVDGGRSPSMMATHLGRRLGLFERQLTVAALTRADGDRLPGMALAAERYPPALAIAPAGGESSPLLLRWQAATRDRLMPVRSPTSIDIEPGLRIELYPTPPIGGPRDPTHPEPTLVALLIYGDVATLFAPSATAQALSALATEGRLRADVLVVPRGGSRGSLDSTILSLVEPRLAIVPVDPRSREGPDQEVLALLGPITTLRTDVHGAIHLGVDGHHLRVTTERNAP